MLKIIRYVDLYDLCVSQRYYTAGSNNAYTDMFQTFCGRTLKPEDFIRLAENIRSHSEHGTYEEIYGRVKGIAKAVEEVVYG